MEESLSINELTERLKEQLSNVELDNSEYKREKDLLKKEDLEKFVLEKTGELVDEGLSTIRELKDIFVRNPDADEIEALSQAFKAVSSALSVLKDIQVTSMKTENNKEIKKMEIDARKELAEAKNDTESSTQKLFLTRDELLKGLIEQSIVVEGDFKKED